MSFTSWDDFWDNLAKIKAGYTRKEKSLHKHIFFGSGSGFSHSHIKRVMNGSIKQSVVKMISNLPKTSVKRCIDYALKNSLDGYGINEKGEKVGSDKILQEWSKDFGKSENSKDAWHLVFSINEPCDDERILRALRESVKDVLGNNFIGHKYAFVLHAHQNNPHVHVVLNKRNIFTNKKIHFDSKADISEFFDEVRTNFAYALGARGLKYENKNSLQKDLRREFAKLKAGIKFETDDYTTKDKINDIYLKMQDKNKEKFKSCEERIKAMKAELDVLKKDNDELLNLYLQYRKKKNKRMYKLAKELKLSNQILGKKRRALLAEIGKINKISFNISRTNEMQLANYKDNSKSLALLENFTYNYNKLFPKNRGASKADFENFKKAKRAIAVLRDKQEDSAKKYFDDSLLLTRMLGQNESLFKLGKKLEILDKNLYVLEHSRLDSDEASSFAKRLNSNKEFIAQACKERLNYVEKTLLKDGSVKNEFLLREYFKGIDMLGIKADDRLVVFKNKIKARSDKSFAGRSHLKDVDKFKKQDIERE